MNTNLDWQSIKDFYKEHFGIQGWVVELFANMDILLLCASGVSNENIEKFLELPMTEVTEVIMNTFGFEGWTVNLPVNPYKIFLDVGESKFKEELLLSLAPYADARDTDLDNLLRVCKTMTDIEGKINDEWI